MNSSVWRNRFRVEDALCLIVVLVLLGFAATGTSPADIPLPEERLWLVSFILFPMSVIIFLASLRYALAAGTSQMQQLLQQILKVIRDWLPFLLFLFFYGTFQAAVWQYVSPEIYDRQLLEIDRWMFGETPAVTMQIFANEPLTDLLALAYFLHLVFPPVMAIVWYRKDLGVFREFLLSIMAAGALGTIGYALVPAVGPGVAFPDLFDVDVKGELFRPLTDWMDVVRAPRDVFPSLHVAVSAIVLYYGARRGRLYFWLLLPFVAANWVSTIYLRYHYFIDVVAGWVTAVLAIWISIKLLKMEAWVRLPAQQRFSEPASSAQEESPTAR